MTILSYSGFSKTDVDGPEARVKLQTLVKYFCRFGGLVEMPDRPGIMIGVMKFGNEYRLTIRNNFQYREKTITVSYERLLELITCPEVILE